MVGATCVLMLYNMFVRGQQRVVSGVSTPYGNERRQYGDTLFWRVRRNGERRTPGTTW